MTFTVKSLINFYRYFEKKAEKMMGRDAKNQWRGCGARVCVEELVGSKLRNDNIMRRHRCPKQHLIVNHNSRHDSQTTDNATPPL